MEKVKSPQDVTTKTLESEYLMTLLNNFKGDFNYSQYHLFDYSYRLLNVTVFHVFSFIAKYYILNPQ